MKITEASDIAQLAVDIAEENIHVASHMTVYAIALHAGKQHLAIPFEVWASCNTFEADSLMYKGAMHRILGMRTENFQDDYGPIVAVNSNGDTKRRAASKNLTTPLPEDSLFNAYVK